VTVSVEARDNARRRFSEERDRWVEVAEAVGVQVRQIAAVHRIRCRITARAKDVPSFVKKAIVKDYADPWNEITDKAGVRAIVETEGALDRLHEAIVDAGSPRVLKVEDRRGTLAPDELGYLGVHLQVLAPRPAGGSDDGAECELQLRTQAQDLWSHLSHTLLYKPAVNTPAKLQRSLYRLLALVELYDQEVERAVAEVQALPGYPRARLLREAELAFHRFVAADFNVALSLEVLDAVAEAIAADELEGYGDRLAAFAAEHAERLQHVYDQYGPASPLADEEPYLLVGQPESMIFFERQQYRPHRLAAAWQGRLGERLVQPLLDIWG